MKTKSWDDGVSDAQVRLGKLFAKYNITTISQAVKAFQRHDNVRIEEWKKQLEKMTAEQK